MEYAGGGFNEELVAVEDDGHGVGAALARELLAGVLRGAARLGTLRRHGLAGTS